MSKKRYTPILPKADDMNKDEQAKDSNVEKATEQGTADGVVEQVAEQETVQTEVKNTEAQTSKEEAVAIIPAEVAIAVQETPKAQEAVSIAPVAVEPVADVVADSAYSENLSRLLDLCKQSGNVAVNNYINELLEYAVKMAPSQTMTRELGAMNQAGLYNTVVNIIDHTGKDFRIAFSTMLCIFNEYKKAAFNGAYVLRFMEEISLSKNKRDAFIKLVNLFSMTADAKTRKDALKHIDLKRELVGGISEEGKMRIIAFYAS